MPLPSLKLSGETKAAVTINYKNYYWYQELMCSITQAAVGKPAMTAMSSALDTPAIRLINAKRRDINRALSVGREENKYQELWVLA
jgi:hypothetical protein